MNRPSFRVVFGNFFFRFSFAHVRYHQGSTRCNYVAAFTLNVLKFENRCTIRVGACWFETKRSKNREKNRKTKFPRLIGTNLDAPIHDVVSIVRIESPCESMILVRVPSDRILGRQKRELHRFYPRHNIVRLV